MPGGSRLEGARRVVVKIGSALLVDPEAGLKAEWLNGLADDVAELRAAGADVVLVSSGAIALGRRMLGVSPGAGEALSLEQAQAAAAVGQVELARAYAEALDARGGRAGQVLFTLADTQDRRRYLNATATLKTLLALGVTPIINENDTVATDEIRYGDNDRLAARAAAMVDADRLLLLSDVDGLYSADPRSDPKARRIEEVSALTPELEAMAGGAGGPTARGGMVTKLQAAKLAMGAGCTMAIARGAPAPPHDPNRPVRALRDGAPATWFLAAKTPQAARKAWISGMKPQGRLLVDNGAAAALRAGRSLLPAGLRAAEGTFDRGDPVLIETVSGKTVATALAAYSAEEARAMIGLQMSEIGAALGYPGRGPLAHRDDMAFGE
ncbi:MAG: glutamate 5-kinase [Pseudomonadota bacterium]